MRILFQKIADLWERNAYHIKRGYRIQEQSTTKAGCALIEESMELLAELLEEDKADMAAVTEEAADVLICLTRILFDCDISVADVLAQADKKLQAIWVNSLAEVRTNTPGFTRRSRASG